MTSEWGRKETIIWPPHAPLWTYSALFAALLCTAFFAWQRFTSLSTLERSYSSEYVRSGFGTLFHQHGNYRLIYLGGGRRKPRLALPTDFEKGLTRLPNGGILPVALSQEATAEGYRFWRRGAEQLLEFTSESQNYYKQGDTIQGEWQGRLAEAFGLAGAVTAADFAHLAEGQHPQTGAQLIKHRAGQEYANSDGTTTKAVEHRAGWDATFSAPKSISLTALVGGDERVRDAHGAAVATALSELERYTQARIGGNHPAETTGQFIAAKFEHDTARPVDGYAAPQLHTHAVIFNVTKRDGSGSGKQFRALQERGLFESQNFATAVYQSALTYQLRNLGYEIEAGKSGAPEIKGYSQEYLDASSPRSQQIREQLDKLGYRSPEAAQIAAHPTRDRKQVLSPAQVLSAHKAMAAAFGNQPEKVIAEARERAHDQRLRPDEGQRAREAVSYARATNFEREAVADERVLLRDALRRGMGETTYAHVRAEFDSRHQQGHFELLRSSKHTTGRSFTTPETIAQERANIAHVLRGQSSLEPMMRREQTTAHAEGRPLLNAGQRRAIKEILTSPDRIHGLQGLAGTGKTTTLAVIRDGAEHSGYAVEGFAPTSRAAAQLREAGISATTLQGFLVRGGQGQSDPAGRHLYMLDESSLASTPQMRDFLSKISPDDRVLVIGDTRQHQAVDQGKPFEQMQQAGMRTSRLDQILRQKDPELLKAVQLLAANETTEGVRLLAEQGRVTQIEDPKERIKAIAKDYAANPQNTMIVSPDNRSRQLINAPATFNAAQWKAFLRSLIYVRPLHITDDVAATLIGTTMTTKPLSTAWPTASSPFALRLALTGHVAIPRQDEIGLTCRGRERFPTTQRQPFFQRKIYLLFGFTEYRQ